MSDHFWAEMWVAAGSAFVIASLAEYWAHRLMHGRLVPGARRHLEHHADGYGQGWLGEFWDYFWPGLSVIWLGFLYSVPAGVSFASTGVLYAAFAAYAHQLQHERPELCFWLPRPVHYLHHKHKMWRHNFGILLDVWDRIFGTYRKVEWNPEKPFWRYPLADFFRISWIRCAPGQPTELRPPYPPAASVSVPVSESADSDKVDAPS